MPCESGEHCKRGEMCAFYHSMDERERAAEEYENFFDPFDSYVEEEEEETSSTNEEEEEEKESNTPESSPTPQGAWSCGFSLENALNTAVEKMETNWMSPEVSLEVPMLDETPPVVESLLEEPSKPVRQSKFFQIFIEEPEEEDADILSKDFSEMIELHKSGCIFNPEQEIIDTIDLDFLSDGLEE